MKAEALVPARVHSSRNLNLSRIQLVRATERDREAIYRIRHDAFASELGQHSTNSAGRLRDALDDFNT